MVIIDNYNEVFRPSAAVAGKIAALLEEDRKNEDCLTYQGTDINDTLEGAKIYL